MNGPLAWCAAENTIGEEYLQIHVPEAETICAIALQGTGYMLGNDHVSAYYVEYSDDGIGWKILEEDGRIKVYHLSM